MSLTIYITTLFRRTSRRSLRIVGKSNWGAGGGGLDRNFLSQRQLMLARVSPYSVLWPSAAAHPAALPTAFTQDVSEGFRPPTSAVESQSLNKLVMVRFRAAVSECDLQPVHDLCLHSSQPRATALHFQSLRFPPLHATYPRFPSLHITYLYFPPPHPTFLHFARLYMPRTCVCRAAVEGGDGGRQQHCAAPEL
jgi:hypothetical protein